MRQRCRPSFPWSLVHRPPNPPSYRHCFPYFSCLPWFPDCLLNELCPSMSCQQKLQTPLHWPWPSSYLTRPDPQLLCTNVPGIVPSVASTWSVKYKVLGSCCVPKCPHCGLQRALGTKASLFLVHLWFLSLWEKHRRHSGEEVLGVKRMMRES